MKGGASFLLGIAVGVLGATLYRRMEERLEEESELELADRLAKQIKLLEARTAALSEKPAAPKRPRKKTS